MVDEDSLTRFPEAAVRTVELIVYFGADTGPDPEVPRGVAGPAGERVEIVRGVTATYFGPVLEESRHENPEVHRYLLDLTEGVEMEEVARFLLDRLEGSAERITVHRHEVPLEEDALTDALEEALGKSWTDKEGCRWHVTLELLGSTKEALEEFRSSGAQLPYLAAQIVFRSADKEYAEEYTGFASVRDLDDGDLRQWFKAARRRSEELDRLDEEDEAENTAREREVAGQGESSDRPDG